MYLKNLFKKILKKFKGELIVTDDYGNVLDDANKNAKVTYPYGKKHWESCQKRCENALLR